MSLIATETERLNKLVNLHDYDVVTISTSGGKDSAAQLAVLMSLADAQGYPREKIVAIHCDLGRMEWDGAHEIVAAQIGAYDLRLEIVKRPQGDLFQHVQDRAVSLYNKWLRSRERLNTSTPVAQNKREVGKVHQIHETTSAAPWFSSTTRYCTSDHKRAQVFKIFTRLANEFRPKGAKATKILDCIGLRAEESPARAKKAEYAPRKDASNGKRKVDTLLPVLHLSTSQVWQVIEEAGLPSHYAYSLGMPRLSCVFCCFAPKKGLLLAGYHNREKLAEIVEIERALGYSFKQDVSLEEIQTEIEAGWEPTSALDASEWEEGKAKTTKGRRLPDAA